MTATHYVAPLDETPLVAVDRVDESAKTRSAWTDAWDSLRTSPMFWISAVLIVLILLVAIVPQLFTHTSPTLGCDLDFSNASPRAGHPLGFTRQGCDVYARVIYGTRASLTVGILATVIFALVGLIIGAVAGYYGGWLDAVVSRLGDIFFSVPSVLGAIVLMSVLPFRNATTVALVLAVFTWPQAARIVRGAVVLAKNSDYVLSAKALGVSRFKILLRHVVPNSIAPLIVLATVSLGSFIVAEATLSFLGIGLPPSVMSWGNDISQAQASIRTAPMSLFYPAVALSITVLAFLMLGDVVRDALDPKARANR
ncbi:ABC transporter permease [Gryllotalpicola kribbensis]|jgi:oligopeptide transport system permease protein|uniref:ABC transporter permease n=2 Tax=Gryllotalpicola kribbensis TaxID=993084 RepID=A0ABP8AKI3_9MICO